MKNIPRILCAAALSALVLCSVQAQPAAPAAAPGAPADGAPRGAGPGGGAGRAGGGARRGGGAGVESGPGSSYRSPEVNANNSLTFRLRAPNAKVVRVLTDMPKLGEVTVHGSAGYDMVKDEATGIWSYTTPALPPSYYQYWFEMDGLTLPDPMNTFVRPATGTPGVYKSVVGVPGKEAEWMMFRDVPHGNLTEIHYLHKENKTARRMVVYTPPDYSTSGKSYPVIYLLHGFNDSERGWTQSGMAHNIMDNLIADGKAVPAIVVMPFGHNATTSMGKVAEIAYTQKALGFTPAPARGGAGGRGAPGAGAAPGAAAPAAPAGPAAGAPPAGGRAGGGARGGGVGGPTADGWSMEKEMLEYVIPQVEKEFRVIKNKNARAIMGYSMGGGHATSIGFGHPEVFAHVGGMSGGGANLITSNPARAATANADYKLIFVGSGTEDTAINGARSSHEAMTALNIKHIFSEDVGYGHDYQVWRQYFYRLAQQTFRD